MRLRKVATGHRFRERLQIAMLRLRARDRRQPSDLTRTLLYRPDYFGRPFRVLQQSVMQGQSEWSVGERHLMAALISRLNSCQFCLGSHTRAASLLLGTKADPSVFDNWHSLALEPQLRAALSFIEKLTLQPEAVNPDDIAPLRKAGVSEAGIINIVYLCGLFNFINRVADALDFDAS